MAWWDTCNIMVIKGLWVNQPQHIDQIIITELSHNKQVVNHFQQRP